MTKSLFVAMAERIAKVEDQHLRLALAILTAEVFGEGNPRFNRAKYMKVCACEFLT